MYVLHCFAWMCATACVYLYVCLMFSWSNLPEINMMMIIMMKVIYYTGWLKKVS